MNDKVTQRLIELCDGVLKDAESLENDALKLDLGDIGDLSIGELLEVVRAKIKALKGV